MPTILEGVLKRSPFSGGWVLETRGGAVHTLRGEVDSTCEEGDRVLVEGELREDLASIDMTGAVLVVHRLVKR